MATLSSALTPAPTSALALGPRPTRLPSPPSQVWSNDRWHAAVHRVRSPGNRDRYSHAHFVNPNEGASFGGAEAASPRYRAFGWADFRAARAKGDASNIGSEVQISQHRVT